MNHRIHPVAWQLVLGLLLVGTLILLPDQAVRAQVPGFDPLINPGEPLPVAPTLQVVLLLTVLSLAPAILILMTSFTRIVVVFGFVRQALGLQQLPPTQILIALALFLTFFLMNPIFGTVYQEAWQPFSDGRINQQEAFERAQRPLKEFMLAQTRTKDLNLFVELSGDGAETPENVSIWTVIPAFAISELKTAFQMGFIIFVPFLIIDMVVASTLMSMGMLMLPPMMISLPFKLLLFVLVDGWYLLVESLLVSYQVAG